MVGKICTFQGLRFTKLFYHRFFTSRDFQWKIFQSKTKIAELKFGESHPWPFNVICCPFFPFFAVIKMQFDNLQLIFVLLPVKKVYLKCNFYREYGNPRNQTPANNSTLNSYLKITR